MKKADETIYLICIFRYKALIFRKIDLFIYLEKKSSITLQFLFIVHRKPRNKYKYLKFSIFSN